MSAYEYIRSLSSRGSDRRREKAGSFAAEVRAAGVAGLLWLAGRGRAGGRGAASSIVVSEESPLVVEDREREPERGVEASEVMFAISVKPLRAVGVRRGGTMRGKEDTEDERTRVLIEC